MSGAAMTRAVSGSTMKSMLTLDDAEPFATRELRAAALDGHDAPPWRIGLQRLGVQFATFGDDSPIRRTGAVGRHGTLNGERIVYVWRGMPERDQALTAWHEYGHGLIVREGLVLACHAERWCTRFAAAMVAPADSVRLAWRAADRDLLRLAEMLQRGAQQVAEARVLAGRQVSSPPSRHTRNIGHPTHVHAHSRVL